MNTKDNDGFEYNFGEKVTTAEANRLFKEIIDIVNSISNEKLKEVVKTMIGTYHKDEFVESPGAVSIHHDYGHGLLKHTHDMIKMGAAICKLRPELNRDLIIAGCAVHDIGKTVEIGEEKGQRVRTTKGNLFGHTLISLEMFSEYASKLGLDKKTTDEVKHIIASHHGELEWGAIVKPAMAEAYIVHAIDMIDSRLEMYSKSTEDIESGSMTESPNKYLGNVNIYKV